MKKKLLISFITCLIAHASAAQVMGGWIKYEYLGVDARAQTFSYYVTVYLYLDRGNPKPLIRVWDASDGTAVKNLSQDPTDTGGFAISNNFSVCTGTASLNNRYGIKLFYFTLTVPINAEGYYLTVITEGRSATLKNIYNPINESALFITKIPGTGNSLGHFKNTTPNILFTDTVSVCRNNYFSLKFEATDADNDSLSISLGDALTQNFDTAHLPPEIPVAYFGSYTGMEPMGSNVSFDPLTGYYSGIAPDIAGGYLVAVYVQEWRKGVLINTTKKELQIKVVNCPFAAPLLRPLYSSCRVNRFTFKNEPTCPGILRYEWDFGDTTTLSDTSTLAMPTYTYPGKGTYTLQLKVANNNGYIDSAKSIVKIFDTITLKLLTDTAICSKDTILLKPESDAASYLWTEAGIGKTLSSYTVKNPKAFPTSNTTVYYVTGRLDGCTDSAALTVHASPYPQSKLGADTVICMGATAYLNGTISGANYYWSPSAALSGSNSLNPTAHPQKTTVYTLSVSDTFYCPKTVTDSMIVKVVPGFTVDAGKDESIVVGQPYQLNAKTTGNTEIVKYAWQPSFYLNDSFSQDPVARINTVGVPEVAFTVKATTIVGGCSSTDIVLLKVYNIAPDILVPTGFTPNNDGKNDVLKPILIGIKKLNFFKVYNRYGKIVFATGDDNNGWDGSVNGNPQESGTYIFIARGVNYAAKTILKKGTVILIR
ncbi:MAG: gliding motility-associated C-terminal domain-containing protein [Ferruginibacter sp.]|nr:gliding motility-associated C-terminal domain-containing protein [Ferruginibacter sp.]